MESGIPDRLLFRLALNVALYTALVVAVVRMRETHPGLHRVALWGCLEWGVYLFAPEIEGRTGPVVAWAALTALVLLFVMAAKRMWAAQRERFGSERRDGA